MEKTMSDFFAPIHEMDLRHPICEIGDCRNWATEKLLISEDGEERHVEWFCEGHAEYIRENAS